MVKNKIMAVFTGVCVCVLSSVSLAQDRPDVVTTSGVHRMLPDAHVTMMSLGQGVAKVSRIRVATTGETFEARADDFLSRHAVALGLDASSLRAVRTEQGAGRVVVSYRQMHGELEVIDRSLTVMLDAKQGDVLRVQSDLVPLRDGAALSGPVERELASAIATQALWGDVPFAALNATRVVVSLPGGAAIVAWAVHVPLRPLVDHMVVLVDSRDGQIIEVRNRTIMN